MIRIYHTTSRFFYRFRRFAVTGRRRSLLQIVFALATSFSLSIALSPRLKQDMPSFASQALRRISPAFCAFLTPSPRS